MYKVDRVHPGWYQDGVEGGEELWRLDTDDKHQIQLFAVATDQEMVFTSFRLFIERDERVKIFSDKRKWYAGHWFGTVDPNWALGLLEMNEAEALVELRKQLEYVDSLPCDESMLNLST